MIDFANFFRQISTPFTDDSSIKLPKSPFSASDFADYRTLNNDDDEYVIGARQETMQGLVDKAKQEAGANKENMASELYRGLLALTDNDGNKYAITSKEFLQNFNALINQVKDDPVNSPFYELTF